MTLDPHTTAQQLADARGSNVRTNRFVKVAAVLTALALLAEVTVFGVTSVRQQTDTGQRLERQLRATAAEQANVLAILHAVQNATDPNSPESQAAAARVNSLLTNLIGCLENDLARETALIRHTPIPALTAGCPADPLAVGGSGSTATSTVSRTTTSTRTTSAPAPTSATTVPCTHPGKQGCKR